MELHDISLLDCFSSLFFSASFMCFVLSLYLELRSPMDTNFYSIHVLMISILYESKPYFRALNASACSKRDVKIDF